MVASPRTLFQLRGQLIRSGIIACVTEIQQTNRAPHILLYSHDTFGLGHLRRSRAIAEALVSSLEGSSALILTGSPVAGRFTFPPGVDHIRMPGVVKTTEAEYVSESLNLDIEQTTALRASVILAAAVTFNPDLIIVDKEPAGFRGELTTTLEILKEMGRAKIVLGIRDILDSPEALSLEWERKGALDIADKFYDQFWVYGDQSIYNPLQSLDISDDFKRRVHYTGYLRRVVPNETPATLPRQALCAGDAGRRRRRRGARRLDVARLRERPDPRARRADRLRPVPQRRAAHGLRPARGGAGAARHRDRLRFAHRGPDAERASASSPWAATTRSARSFPSTAAR